MTASHETQPLPGIFTILTELESHTENLERYEDKIILNRNFNAGVVAAMGIDIVSLMGGYYYLRSEIAKNQGDINSHQKERTKAIWMRTAILAASNDGNYFPLGFQLKRLSEEQLFAASAAQAQGQHYSPTLGLKYLEMAEVLLYMAD